MAQVAYSEQDLIGQAVGTEARKEDTDVLFYHSLRSVLKRIEEKASADAALSLARHNPL